MSPARTGRRGRQACWEQSKCCASSLLWSVCCSSEHQPVSYHSGRGLQVKRSSPPPPLKTDQTKGKFGKSCTVTNVCIVFNQSLSLKKENHVLIYSVVYVHDTVVKSEGQIVSLTEAQIVSHLAFLVIVSYNWLVAKPGLASQCYS